MLIVFTGIWSFRPNRSATKESTTNPKPRSILDPLAHTQGPAPLPAIPPPVEWDQLNQMNGVERLAGLETQRTGSQYYQDEAVYRLVFEGRPGTTIRLRFVSFRCFFFFFFDLFLILSIAQSKTFVEFGASNGLYHSNSLFFERVLGWSGVLIEGHPQLFEETRKNRPQAKVLHALVCDEHQKLDFSYFNTIGLSGVLNAEQEAKILKSLGGEVRKVVVRCDTLDSLLGEAGLSPEGGIGLMSIDVEGFEQKVLKSFDFKKWRVDVVLIEVDYESKGKMVVQWIREYFRATGLYREPYRADTTHPDDIYIRKDVPVRGVNDFQIKCPKNCCRVTQCVASDVQLACGRGDTINPCK
jgi:FkbM family methyltransferase